jgi:hypothetical protein
MYLFAYVASAQPSGHELRADTRRMRPSQRDGET